MTRGRLPFFKQAQQMLSRHLEIGSSRHESKLTGEASGIHSWGTYEAYAKALTHYAEWYHDTYGGHKVADMNDHVTDYINHLRESGYSADTQKQALSACRKVWGTDVSDAKTDARSRAEITRSRGVAARDRHFSLKNNAELVSTCEATGLRRTELEHLHGGCCEQRDDGHWYITGLREATGDHTKGGRDRDVRIVADAATAASIASKINSTPSDSLVYGQVHSACDVHGYRGTYACHDYMERVQDRYGADGLDMSGKSIPEEDRYYCRGDMQGVVLSRQTLREVSEDMGHSRESVVVSHYLYQMISEN